jgi:hypothetical protein
MILSPEFSFLRCLNIQESSDIDLVHLENKIFLNSIKRIKEIKFYLKIPRINVILPKDTL